MNALDQLKAQWGRIPAKRRRYVVLGGGGSLIILLLWFFAASGGEKRQDQTGQDVIRNVLTNNDTRDIGIDALSSRLDSVVSNNRDLNKEIERLKNENEKSQNNNGPVSRDQFEELKTRLENESKARKKLERRLESGGNSPGQAAGSMSTENSDEPDQGSAQPASARYGQADNGPVSTNDIFNTRDHSEADSSQLPIGSDDDTSGAKAGPPEIISITAAPAGSEDANSDRDEDPVGGYLPAGSMITGVNITGMDAPTGIMAKQDPFPITLRVKHEAILPNRFTQDIKECFLIASGYGDLSSERVYLRAETLSCIREDGGAIEKSLKAFASGEDGKAGVRGRLVSKQGSVIANSLTAGFLGGAAQAFDVNPVPAIATSPGGQQQYQSVLSANALQGAAVDGVSSALDRIAQFYIDMAEDMYPVIEVNAGRRITFIVQKGVDLDAN